MALRSPGVDAYPKPGEDDRVSPAEDDRRGEDRPSSPMDLRHYAEGMAHCNLSRQLRAAMLRQLPGKAAMANGSLKVTGHIMKGGYLLLLFTFNTHDFLWDVGALYYHVGRFVWDKVKTAINGVKEYKRDYHNDVKAAAAVLNRRREIDGTPLLRAALPGLPGVGGLFSADQLPSPPEYHPKTGGKKLTIEELGALPADAEPTALWTWLYALGPEGEVVAVQGWAYYEDPPPAPLPPVQYHAQYYTLPTQVYVLQLVKNYGFLDAEWTRINTPIPAPIRRDRDLLGDGAGHKRKRGLDPGTAVVKKAKLTLPTFPSLRQRRKREEEDDGQDPKRTKTTHSAHNHSMLVPFARPIAY